MTNKNSKLYISDQTEAEEQSAPMGDTEVLIAGEEDINDDYEKSGNQSSEYYKK